MIFRIHVLFICTFFILVGCTANYNAPYIHKTSAFGSVTNTRLNIPVPDPISFSIPDGKWIVEQQIFSKDKKICRLRFIDTQKEKPISILFSAMRKEDFKRISDFKFSTDASDSAFITYWLDWELEFQKRSHPDFQLEKIQYDVANKYGLIVLKRNSNRLCEGIFISENKGTFIIATESEDPSENVVLITKNIIESKKAY